MPVTSAFFGSVMPLEDVKSDRASALLDGQGAWVWNAGAVSNDDVTAVIPCFNHGRYLREAVDSLLTQSDGPPKVVVVDDGSTDRDTDAALGSLPEPVAVVRQANSGVSIARNRGFAESGTPYVLFLDADDRLAPGALRALRAPLDADEGHRLGFAYGHQRFFGEMQGDFRFPPYDPYRLLDRHLIGPTALMRRELMLDTGGYDPEFRRYEDWEIWINALAHGWRGVRIDAFTHEYRRAGGSKLSRDRREYHELRRQLRTKHEELYRRRGELATESDLGPAGRLIYRGFWGPRPVPAGVEVALHRALWGPRGLFRARRA
jgi:glycosyltransferase involved in cell wall biosynthesis